MFTDISTQIIHNQLQMSYGIAVTDADGDGLFEIVVAGYGFPNLVLKWVGTGLVNIADPVLSDAYRQAIGVAAGDIDRDGREEIYFLNTDTFAGAKRYGDRLFAFRKGRWSDLFESPENLPVRNLQAGRSVACVDRMGNGHYGFFVVNYGTPSRFYEFDSKEILQDLAPALGLAQTTGGRSVLALPLVSHGMDIIVGNENGPNFLFYNRGDGTFEELATQVGLADPHEHARGMAALDANDDGLFDLVVGNWEGAHRLFLQLDDGRFEDVAPPAMAFPSRVRTVIAADFDNDGHEEIFFNQIGQANRLFGFREDLWQGILAGDAEEPHGLGTGAAVGDFDSDGRLELIIAHGEAGLQPLSMYRGPANRNGWVRVLPLTRYGAPARGAFVTLVGADRAQRRVIDAGSGYLCQMEPVAHFGLGKNEEIERIIVRWPGGEIATIEAPQPRQLHHVQFPVKTY